MEEFQKQIGKGYIIESVNIPSGSLHFASIFNKHLDTDINLGYKTIIIDLTNCSSLDSAFIGVLVITLKQLMKIGGSIKIVKPGMFSNSLFNFTGTIEKFELFESIENAIKSISIPSQNKSSNIPLNTDSLALAG
jgi:anti-sigma B factor antagonist/stage II sporulation protein AA (anti-sigma F factor antagonist)